MEKKDMLDNLRQAMEEVRSKNPMAASITNTVTINFVANAQIAVGGSAAMFYYADEGLALAELGGATYVNLGTFLPVYRDSVPALVEGLDAQQRPWVFDPVSLTVGAERHKVIMAMKNHPPKIVRGNSSEIIALAKIWGLEVEDKASGTRGVDSTEEVEEAKESAIALAKFIEGAVAVSGPIDLITDGQALVYAKGGSHFMEKITGAGCALGGVCAIYLSVTDPMTAALTGSIVFNKAGTKAESMAKGPASYQSEFLDSLYELKSEDIALEDFDWQTIKE